MSSTPMGIGRNIIWVGSAGEQLIRIPIRYAQHTPLNIYDQTKLLHFIQIIKDAEMEGTKVTFPAPFGYISRVTATEVKEMQQSYAEDPDRFRMEYEQDEPWTIEDIGALGVQLRDGNHRLAAARQMGEDYIFVRPAPHQRNTVFEVGAVPTPADLQMIEKRFRRLQATDMVTAKNDARYLFEHADPSPGRPYFGVWLISLVIQPQTVTYADGRTQEVPQLTNAKEDAPKIREVLEKYLEVRQLHRLHKLWQLLGRSGDDRDLNKPVDGKWIEYRALHRAVNALTDRQKLIADTKAQELLGNVNILYIDDEMQVVEILSSEATNTLCDGTAWCVRYSEVAKKYLAEGPLYLFRKRNLDTLEYDNYALCHFGAGAFFDQHKIQFADIEDYPLSADMLNQIAPFLFVIVRTRIVNSVPAADAFFKQMFADSEMAKRDMQQAGTLREERQICGKLAMMVYNNINAIQEYQFTITSDDDGTVYLQYDTDEFKNVVSYVTEDIDRLLYASINYAEECADITQQNTLIDDSEAIRNWSFLQWVSHAKFFPPLCFWAYQIVRTYGQDEAKVMISTWMPYWFDLHRDDKKRAKQMKADLAVRVPLLGKYKLEPITSQAQAKVLEELILQIEDGYEYHWERARLKVLSPLLKQITMEIVASQKYLEDYPNRADEADADQ